MAESTGLTQIHPCICPLRGAVVVQNTPGILSNLYFKNKGSHQGLSLCHKKTAQKRRLFIMAEREGFEPSVPGGTHTFQACSFGHSDTSPKRFNQLKRLI